MTDQHVDIAIVGGEIAGLYCCFHLASRYDGAHPAGALALYKSSDRLGGKIETWRIDPKTIEKQPAEPIKIRDLIGENRNLAESTAASPKVLRDLFVAEFGPMRIEPDHQPYLKALLTKLGIKEEGEQPKWSDLVPFPAYRGEPPTEPRFTLEDEEAEQTSLIDLLLLALRRVCEVLRFDGADSEAPWVLRDPRDPHNEDKPLYDAANFFWREFRQERFLHRRFWKRSLRQWINLLNEDHYEDIREKARFRGTLLRDMGFWNLLGAVLSHMATVKLRDWASFYHLLPENPGAADWLIFWLRAIKSTDALRGIRGGMDWIVHSLSQREPLNFQIDPDQQETADRIYPLYRHGSGADPKLFLARKLIKVEECDRNGKGYLRLTFREMTKAGGISTITADHAILALPKSALQEIEFECDDRPGEALKILFDAVSVIPLLKCFFIVKDPFWEDNRPASRYAHTTPTRELHYWKNRDRTRGMMMIYTDRPGTQFWCDYMVEGLKVNLADEHGLPGADFKTVRRDRPTAQIWNWIPQEGLPAGHVGESFANDRLLRTFLAYSTEDGAESVTAERLLAAGMHDWGLKPYEGAAHAWRPGSDPKRIMEYFCAFSLKACGEKRLHICGEAYSDYQGFMEGALRSAAEVLVHEFGVPRSKLTGEKDGASRRLARAPAVPFEPSHSLGTAVLLEGQGDGAGQIPGDEKAAPERSANSMPD